MSNIIVFNATGMQGQTIVNKLKNCGHKVTTPVRSAEKASYLASQEIEAFVTDFSASSLMPELKRADKVVLQIPAAIAPSTMFSITKSAIDAIKQAGYPKTIFVISSTIPHGKVGVGSVDVRVEMRDYCLVNLPETPILSSTEYLENFSTAYREAIEIHGIIPQTIPPQLPVNYLSWEDLAVYVEAALRSDKIQGKLYRIGGNEGITGHDLEKRLGSVLGKKLHYTPITHEQLASFLTSIMGKDIARDYAEFYEYQDTKGHELLNPDTSSIRKLLDVKLQGFENWARKSFNKYP